MSRVDNNYFTYRQTPTTESGTGTFESIKGNTLVWNQLIENGNFTSTDGWRISNGNATASNNILTVTANATILQVLTKPSGLMLTQGHKILISCGIKSSVAKNDVRLRMSQDNPLAYIQTISKDLSANAHTNISGILTVESNTVNTRFAVYVNGSASGETYELDNFVAFDLTKMGLGSITSVDEFKALFPLPFYQFEQGKLLSFNGNGIKTVSKNQFDTQVVTTSYQGLTLTKTQGTIRAVYSGGSQYAGFNFYGSPVFTDTFLKGKYRLSFDVKGLDTQWTVGLRKGASFLGGGQARAFSNDGHYSFTIDTEANPNCYLSFARTGNKTTAYDVTFSNIQLELGTTETSYTQYEEKTISLPISQYFPDGMDGINDVRDEKNETGYVKRIGRVTFDGSSDENWNVVLNTHRAYITVSDIDTSTPDSSVGNIMSNIYTSGAYSKGEWFDIITTRYGIAQINIFDSVNITPSSTTATWRAYLQEHPLIVSYELSTPLENYGVVDLGTLTWAYAGTNSSEMRMYSDDIKSLVKPSASTNVKGNLTCALYPNDTADATYVKQTCIAVNQTGRIFVYDPNYNTTSSPSAFKTAMSGVYLYYEMATPTETDISPELDLTFNIDAGGTEELLPTNTSTPTTTPILCDIFYRGLIPVSVTVYPLGAGTVTGAGQYRYGETATLVATPNDIYRFLRYEDENGDTLSTDSTYSFEVGE